MIEEKLCSGLKARFPALHFEVVHASRRERERGLGPELHVTCAVHGQLKLRRGVDAIALPANAAAWDLADIAAQVEDGLA